MTCMRAVHGQQDAVPAVLVAELLSAQCLPDHRASKEHLLVFCCIGPLHIDTWGHDANLPEV